MAILNEKNEEVGENIEGEICIRGYNVANGYLGDLEKIAHFEMVGFIVVIMVERIVKKILFSWTSGFINNKRRGEYLSC